MKKRLAYETVLASLGSQQLITSPVVYLKITHETMLPSKWLAEATGNKITAESLQPLDLNVRSFPAIQKASVRNISSAYTIMLVAFNYNIMSNYR